MVTFGMLHSRPAIAVIVLGYNDLQHLEGALESTLCQDYPNYRTIFVDSASSDDSVAFVKQRFPGVEVISLQVNLGYAGAYRVVLSQVLDDACDAAVLLNADVEVDANWLSELVQSAYASEDIGFAQPKIYLWDGRVLNSFGNCLNFLGFGYCGRYGEPDSDATTRDAEVALASGACLLVKRLAYWDVEGLDESFFAYVEDQDLVWRGRMRGWRAVASAESKMRHKYRFLDPSRNKQKVLLYERNRIRFIVKNYSLGLIVCIAPAFVLVEVGILFQGVLRGYLWQKCRAYVEVVHGLPRLLAARRRVQQDRVVGDCDLILLMSPTIEFPELGGGLGMRVLARCLGMYYRVLAWGARYWRRRRVVSAVSAGAR